ncbi:MAG: MarR family transcriptional regulator [Nitrosopumilus sp.]|nr:MarR family transcriptional regulator [Nitrosopumilus sp.]MDH3516822.1 MarR family transcriptional regulator [Nitrosopumilus sp.]MDH3565226.1 MarR family transcriptional regulator [Nitrosopumilus sp.]MDH5555091.1 MarR family transcriptional regulator [Nitrosopumilus sp.]
MLKTSAKSWEKAADIKMHERFDLTGAQWKIIAVLSIKEGITQKTIADMIFVEAPTLVPVIDKMEKEGYLTRQSDPKDRRNNLIFMTKKSKDVVDPIIDSILEIRNMGLDKISKKDMEVTKKVLEQIRANTEEFIKQMGEKMDPDLWTDPQNKSQKILVKL